MESEAGNKLEVGKRCIRCGIPTIAMCPRCRKYVCMKGSCNESHDMKCPPEKEEPVAKKELTTWKCDFCGNEKTLEAEMFPDGWGYVAAEESDADIEECEEPFFENPYLTCGADLVKVRNFIKGLRKTKAGAGAD